jgi:hypothetical protein
MFALARLQAVVVVVLGEGIQRQAQRLAFGLARLALGFELVALGAALAFVERDGLLGLLLAELRHVLAPPLEFLVLRHARGMQGIQARQQRREVAVLRVRHGGDAGPRQRVVVGAFAELGRIHRHREADVRHHALVLRAAAAHAEELRDGQLHLAEARFLVGRPAIQVDQVLHRALAERSSRR